jgi:hypothetical protein
LGINDEETLWRNSSHYLHGKVAGRVVYQYELPALRVEHRGHTMLNAFRRVVSDDKHRSKSHTDVKIIG